MAIPIIAGAIALGVTVYGAKKGYDAKCDFDEACKINEKAMSMLQDAKQSLEKERRKIQILLKECASLSEQICKTTLSQYEQQCARLGRSISKPTKTGNIILDEKVFKNLDLKKASVSIADIALEGVGALGSGALAGFVMYGAAVTLHQHAMASQSIANNQETATSQENTTTQDTHKDDKACEDNKECKDDQSQSILAWLGGGEGNEHIGMVVLGGIIIAPVLLFTGLFVSNRAEAIKEQSKASYVKAEVASEEMKLAISKLQAIAEVVELKKKIMQELDEIFKHNMGRIQAITHLTNTHQKVLERGDLLYACLAKVIVDDFALIDADGLINEEARQQLESIETVMVALNHDI